MLGVEGEMAASDILNRIKRMTGVTLRELPERTQRMLPPSREGREIGGFLHGASPYRNLALRERLGQFASRIGVDDLDNALRRQLVKRFLQSGDMASLPRVQGNRLRSLLAGEGME